MDAHVIALVVPVIGMISFVIMLVMFRKFQNDERMGMIEKGIPFPEKTPHRISIATYLTYGFLAVGSGIGLLIAQFLDRGYGFDAPLYFALLLIGGGLGLITAYWVQYKMDKK